MKSHCPVFRPIPYKYKLHHCITAYLLGLDVHLLQIQMFAADSILHRVEFLLLTFIAYMLNKKCLKQKL